MSAAIHPAAAHDLPGFITAPGDVDVLMTISLIMLVCIVTGIGVFYLKLHALPEKIAHKGEKVQFQFVAVLALIALFTHNHVFWIVALLLAFIRIPDFSTPLAGIATSLARMADARGRPERSAPAVPDPPIAGEQAGKPKGISDA